MFKNSKKFRRSYSLSERIKSALCYVLSISLTVYRTELTMWVLTQSSNEAGGLRRGDRHARDLFRVNKSPITALLAAHIRRRTSPARGFYICDPAVSCYKLGRSPPGTWCTILRSGLPGPSRCSSVELSVAPVHSPRLSLRTIILLAVDHRLVVVRHALHTRAELSNATTNLELVNGKYGHGV